MFLLLYCLQYSIHYRTTECSTLDWLKRRLSNCDSAEEVGLRDGLRAISSVTSRSRFPLKIRVEMRNMYICVYMYLQYWTKSTVKTLNVTNCKYTIHVQYLLNVHSVCTKHKKDKYNEYKLCGSGCTSHVSLACAICFQFVTNLIARCCLFLLFTTCRF